MVLLPVPCLTSCLQHIGSVFIVIRQSLYPAIASCPLLLPTRLIPTTFYRVAVIVPGRVDDSSWDALEAALAEERPVRVSRL
jgi:hypothetical protein